jgi:hypothetical protein
VRAELLDEVRHFLPALEATQTELAALFGEKRRAAKSADAQRMLELAEAEAGLARRLEGHVEDRQRILERARQEGRPADSIAELVAEIGGSGSELLRSRIDAARRRASSLRSESWIQWVMSQRAVLHYAELVELIAHCGQQPPVYGPAPREHRSGGALLDATA